jgi:pimeloyl-ACP methyl ester carboxylesterase
MEQARINGVELPYEVAGSGEAVLLISNGPIADGFAPFASEGAMADRHRLIRYRQRRMAAGTNGPHGPAPVSFAQHAADAAALLRHLGVRRAHVAGHSTGAIIALQLAVDHPDVVHTLALLEPPLVSVPSAAAFFEKAAPALAAYGSGDRDGAVAAFLSMVSSLDWETCRTHIDRHVPGGVAQAIADADDLFGSYLPALGAWQFGPEQAAAVSQPVLSVLGAETERLFAESHELLHAWFPQVEDCTIDGVAHLLQLQRPGPVARGVAEFFARHPLVRRESAGAHQPALVTARVIESVPG